MQTSFHEKVPRYYTYTPRIYPNVPIVLLYPLSPDMTVDFAPSDVDTRSVNFTNLYSYFHLYLIVIRASLIFT